MKSGDDFLRKPKGVKIPRGTKSGTDFLKNQGGGAQTRVMKTRRRFSPNQKPKEGLRHPPRGRNPATVFSQQRRSRHPLWDEIRRRFSEKNNNWETQGDTPLPVGRSPETISPNQKEGFQTSDTPLGNNSGDDFVQTRGG